MTPVALPVIIVFLFIVVAIYFLFVDTLRNRINKGAGPFVARSTALATGTGPVGVSYLDMATPAPAAAVAAVPVAMVTGPVGVGYMDEGPPAPAVTPAPAAAFAPACTWPSAPPPGPLGVGYMDV
jgi:hypothetical protein